MFPEKAESFGRELVADSLARAFVLSLLLHFLAIASIEFGRGIGLWQVSLLPKSLRPTLIEEIQKTAKQREEMRQAQAQQQPEAELVFIDVDPAQSAPEPPKDAKYYSDKNMAAANADTGNKNVPKLSGKQELVPKVKDTPRPDPKAVQPEPAPAPKQEPQAPPQQQPSPAPPPRKFQDQLHPAPVEKPPAEKQGETLMARAEVRPEPQLQSNPSPPAPPLRHARTLAEAKANKGIIEGKQMKQEGGVSRYAIDPGMDVKATPFGAYDAAFIMAVQARWFSLLDERNYVGNDVGKVVVEFRLHQDGRISHVHVIDSQVSEIFSWFCQRAILDPAPYRPFPSDLRRMLDGDYREIRFTFYYNQ